MAPVTPPAVALCPVCKQAPAIWVIVLQYLAQGAPADSTSPVEIQYPVPLCDGCARLDAGESLYMNDDVFAQICAGFAAVGLRSPDRGRCTVIRKPWMQSLPADMPTAD